MAESENQIAFENLITHMIRFLSKVNGKVTKWISDLKYYKYMEGFGYRDDDIWVSTYMKSGTTLTQMLLYQLTTDGNMDFEHINHLSPWVRNASIRDFEPIEFPSPRIIKTHDPYHTFEKGTKGRFIVVIRDGRDLGVSLYHHRKNYNTPDLTFNESFESVFEKKGEMNWFTFMKEWLENKKRLNILYIKYEDLIYNFDETVNRIIEFCNLEVNDEILKRVKERCSFGFMKKHEDKFGIEKFEEQRVIDQFIRNGKVGEGKECMSNNQKKLFNKNFEKILGELNEKMNLNYKSD